MFADTALLTHGPRGPARGFPMWGRALTVDRPGLRAIVHPLPRAHSVHPFSPPQKRIPLGLPLQWLPLSKG